jgi:hypothetical protein
VSWDAARAARVEEKAIVGSARVYDAVINGDPR